jgi:hypothetical protein
MTRDQTSLPETESTSLSSMVESTVVNSPGLELEMIAIRCGFKYLVSRESSPSTTAAVATAAAAGTLHM